MPSPEIPAPAPQSGEKKGFFARLREGLSHPNEASQVAQLEKARADQQKLREEREESRAKDVEFVDSALRASERPIAPAANLAEARAKLEAAAAAKEAAQAQSASEQPAVERRDAA